MDKAKYHSYSSIFANVCSLYMDDKQRKEVEALERLIIAAIIELDYLIYLDSIKKDDVRALD